MNCADPSIHNAHGACDGNVRVLVAQLTEENAFLRRKVQDLTAELTLIRGFS